MKTLKPYLIAAFHCFSCQLFAQTGNFSFTVGSATVSSGELFCLPVSVQDFVCMGGFQFSLHVDPQVIDFHHVQAFNLPGLNAGSFNYNDQSDHLLVVWYDPSPTFAGVTVPDETVIYEVCYTANGPSGSSTPAVIGDMGFGPTSDGAFAFDCNLTPAWTDTFGINGLVVIDHVVPASTPPGVTRMLSVSPNPFSQQSRVVFSLTEPGPVVLRVVDALGKIVLEEKTDGIAGENRLDIAGARLPGVGAYEVMVETADGLCARRVLKYE